MRGAPPRACACAWAWAWAWAWAAQAARAAARRRALSAARPPARRFQRAWQALVRTSNLRTQSMGAREASTVAWALGRLGAPQDQWLLDDVTCCSHELLRSRALDSRQLAMLAYGLAARRQVLPEPWLGDFEAASLAALPCASSQSLANTAWALVRLGRRPGEAWQAAFFGASLPLLGGMPRQELEQLLWALSHSRVLAAGAPTEW